MTRHAARRPRADHPLPIQRQRSATTAERDGLDPDSPAGIAAADAISDFGAEVRTRLRREGRPIPDQQQTA